MHTLKNVDGTIFMHSATKQDCDQQVRQSRLVHIVYHFLEPAKKNRNFLLIIACLLVIANLVAPYPLLARWFGFILASYSAIANDSIQTIGTFIAANAHRKWWHLWLYIGLIFVATMTYSWVVYHGDVSYQRLTERGFSEAPTSFTFAQLLAPIILLVLTRWQIPVSTSFLLLNVFATESSAVYHVMQKSLVGYVIAFVVALVFWYPFSKITDSYFKAKPWKGWMVLQWLISGLLWSVWLMQDASNIVIFLPRHLNVAEFLLVIGCIFLGLGLLFYLKGDRMQQLVNERSGITNVRASTLVSLVYMLVLFYFNQVNQVPMSTTWVFIGLLGGREIAISLSNRILLHRKKVLQRSIQFIKRDLKNALIGLLISIALAFLVNGVIRETIVKLLKSLF
jgi:hypothetical protein